MRHDEPTCNEVPQEEPTPSDEVAAAGAVPPGLYTFANEGIWSATFRLQRNFIP